jgi:hypothetical protein
MSNIIYLLQKLQTMVSHDINPLFVNYLVCNFFYGSYMDERMELLIIFKLFMNEIQTFFFLFQRQSWNNVKF